MLWQSSLSVIRMYSKGWRFAADGAILAASIMFSRMFSGIFCCLNLRILLRLLMMSVIDVGIISINGLTFFISVGWYFRIQQSY